MAGTVLPSNQACPAAPLSGGAKSAADSTTKFGDIKRRRGFEGGEERNSRRLSEGARLTHCARPLVSVRRQGKETATTYRANKHRAHTKTREQTKAARNRRVRVRPPHGCNIAPTGGRRETANKLSFTNYFQRGNSLKITAFFARVPYLDTMATPGKQN